MLRCGGCRVSVAQGVSRPKGEVAWRKGRPFDRPRVSGAEGRRPQRIASQSGLRASGASGCNLAQERGVRHTRPATRSPTCEVERPIRPADSGGVSPTIRSPRALMQRSHGLS